MLSWYYQKDILGTSNSETETLQESDTMKHLQPQALYECLKYKYSKQCQILANLWVLHMYDENATPCAALKSVSIDNSTVEKQNNFYEDDGWKEDYPWLYYSKNGRETIRNKDRVKTKMTLSTSKAGAARYSHIPFKLAKYNLEGDFLGWEDLSNQIWMCKVSVKDSEKYRRVGLGIVDLWEFNLKDLVDRTIHLDNLNYFFELFLVDYNGDLIDVPVLIDNFIDSGTTYPNRESGNLDSWRFVRRFFLYENVSAIVGDGEYLNPTKPPQYVRFIHESRLVFEMDIDEDEQIYVPYLHIWYRSINTTDLTTDTPTPWVVVTQWKMTASYARELLLGFLIFSQVLIGIWIFWKCYQWATLHPQNYESSEFLFYIGRILVYEIFETWSGFMFWFLFLASFIWFILFKFGTAFYVLLPDNYVRRDIYRPFDIIFGIVLCMKILALWGRIWYQWNVDIFFLDRERRNKDSAGSPNAWRLIFVSNEYNEMQHSQYVSIEYTLFWFLFFMVGEGWEGWAAQDPDFTEHAQDSHINEYLKFCITVSLLLSIGLIQFLIKILFSFAFPLPFQNFVDLCSITNMSVFIFDQRIHGYYIHGVSTCGQSDVTTSELQSYLDKENRGESSQRGLISEHPNLQTFEIYLPVKIRQRYEVVYKQPVLNEITIQRRNMSAIDNSSRLFSLGALPRGLNIQALVNSRDEASQYFINYVSQVKNYPSIALKDRGLWQMFSEFPPMNLNEMETPLFLRDYLYGFRKVFFSGLDFDILVLIACLYTVLDIWELNFLQSTVIIYSYYKIFIELPRKFFGSRNLATKTLVETRFLL